MKFQRSELATKLLSGLKGIEIGAAAHNPFYLDTMNVDWTDSRDTSWTDDQMRMCGEKAWVDVIANGSRLPFSDGQWDFVISSHCLEHNWDIIATLKEWLRVIKQGGFVFTIFPHPERTFDKGRERTTLAELIARHEGKIERVNALNTHYTVWHLEDALECVKHIGGAEVVATQDPDDKVGNGFTFVIKKV